MITGQRLRLTCDRGWFYNRGWPKKRRDISGGSDGGVEIPGGGLGGRRLPVGVAAGPGGGRRAPLAIRGGALIEARVETEHVEMVCGGGDMGCGSGLSKQEG